MATITTLVSFTGTNGASDTDGQLPVSGLIADTNGDLFGTTEDGGTSGDGTVFELVNNGDGTYTPTILLSFDDTGTEGATPAGGLIADSSGDLFGTTESGGGFSGDGTV